MTAPAAKSWVFRPGEEPEQFPGWWPNVSKQPEGTWLFTGMREWKVWGVYEDGTPDWWKSIDTSEVPKDIRTTLLLLGG